MKYLLQHCCKTTRSCRHKALLSSSGPDCIGEKYLDRATVPIVAASGKRGYTLWDLVWPRAGGPTSSLCAEWPKASLLCGTQVTRVKIYGGVGASSARVLL